MNVKTVRTYHIFNRSRNLRPVCQVKRNYHHLRELLHDTVHSRSELLAYCILPDRFHLLIRPYSPADMPCLTRELNDCLHEYSRIINQQLQRTGYCFSENSCVRPIRSNYKNPGGSEFHNCFRFIHLNPIKCKLTDRMEHWQYSSFREYLDQSDIGFCNTELGMTLLGFAGRLEFYAFSYGRHLDLRAMSVDLRMQL